VKYQDERKLYDLSVSLEKHKWREKMSDENSLVCMKYCTLSNNERRRFPGLVDLLNPTEFSSFKDRSSSLLLTTVIKALEQNLAGIAYLFLVQLDVNFCILQGELSVTERIHTTMNLNQRSLGLNQNHIMVSTSLDNESVLF
jgi:superfamily II DNA/RNA helicase